MRPELLAAAGVDHQLDVRADRVAGRLDEQLVGLRVAPAERPPAELDRLEAAGDGVLQLLAQRVRLVEQDRAVRLDACRGSCRRAAATTGWFADLAEQVPQGDVDAADGVLDGAAAALPEGGLPQLLGDARRLVGALADEERPQQLDAALDERLAGRDTLPTPIRPSSVRTSTMVWTSSSGLSSSAQPPSTVPPARPVMRMSAMNMSSPGTAAVSAARPQYEPML